MSDWVNKANKSWERVRRLDELVRKVTETEQLEHWNTFIRDMKVPNEMVPAMASNRVELLKLVKARPMDASEVQVMLDMIMNLMQTNQALRSHAEQVAQMMILWTDAFKTLRALGFNIQEFASFRTIQEGYDE